MEEVSRIDVIHAPEFKFAVVPALDVCTASAVFALPPNRLHALTLLFRADTVPRITRLLRQLQDRHLVLATHLQAVLLQAHYQAGNASTQQPGADPLDLAVARWQVHLDRLWRDYAQWCTSSLDRDSLFQQSWLSHSTLGHQFVEWLARCITAHVATGGCSVVVGAPGHDALVDMCRTVATLGLFSDDMQCAVSSATPLSRFVPGLCIQAVTLPSNSSSGHAANSGTTYSDAALASSGASSDKFRGIPDDLLLQSPFPVALIDLEGHRVRRVRRLSEYGHVRASTIGKLALDAPVTLPWVKVIRAAPAILRMLETALSLPEHLRPAWVSESVRILRRRAMEIVSYVWDLGRDGIVEGDVRGDLMFDNEDDFVLCVALAETMAPGTFVKVFGDLHAVGERVLALFESFGYS
jgi:hypothetical protein